MYKYSFQTAYLEIPYIHLYLCKNLNDVFKHLQDKFKLAKCLHLQASKFTSTMVGGTMILMPVSEGVDRNRFSTSPKGSGECLCIEKCLIVIIA